MSVCWTLPFSGRCQECAVSQTPLVPMALSSGASSGACVTLMERRSRIVGPEKPGDIGLKRYVEETSHDGVPWGPVTISHCGMPASLAVSGIPSIRRPSGLRSLI